MFGSCTTKSSQAALDNAAAQPATLNIYYPIAVFSQSSIFQRFLYFNDRVISMFIYLNFLYERGKLALRYHVVQIPGAFPFVSLDYIIK
jgi:hypothetical protein